jgi:SAM-dependent methyltransferase
VEWLKETSKNMTIDSILCAGTCAIQLPQTGAEDGGTSEFPVASSYDVVTGFSVVTHQAPPDAAHLFRLARKVVRPGGVLVISAFCDDSVEVSKIACRETALGGVI